MLRRWVKRTNLGEVDKLSVGTGLVTLSAHSAARAAQGPGPGDKPASWNDRYSSPRSRARRTAAARVRTPSLLKMRLVCVRRVLTVT